MKREFDPSPSTKHTVAGLGTVLLIMLAVAWVRHCTGG